ncbi:hypothetical protein AKO1_011968 [Acrasis kona]|uniref:Uncharacterized protein n=1 Tax=Acrasis kona TaxID=1008807 RepID=A0AAW2ZA47_9EUKA
MGSQPSVEDPNELDFSTLFVECVPNHQILWPTLSNSYKRPESAYWINDSPIFDVGIHTLKLAFEVMMSKELKTRVVRRNDLKNQITWEQKTIMREYIDWITVEFVGNDKTSTFYAISRSSASRFDFGTNSRRLYRLVECVKQELQNPLPLSIV